MKTPIRFVTDNIVVNGDNDMWGVYRLGLTSYDGLATQGKLDLFGQMATLCYRLERNFQLLRVNRTWNTEDYLERARQGLHPTRGHAKVFNEHLAAQARHLGSRTISTPEVFITVKLHTAAPSLQARLSSAAAAGHMSLKDRILGVVTPPQKGLGARLMREVAASSAEVMHLMDDYLPCEQASAGDIAWLIRRAYTRGVGDAPHPEGFQPQALLIDTPDGQTIEPMQTDILRLFEEPLTLSSRGIVADTDTGHVHQAMLMLGELPEAVTFPGHQAELLFRPLSDMEFPVDACVWAEYVSNKDAVNMIRRRIIDADNVHREESLGDHGPSAQSAVRPSAARSLEDYLTSNRRPPLMRTTISLAVGADTAEELESRIHILRRAYGAVHLHRPLGDQLAAWAGHLPGQAMPNRDYADMLLVENLAGMVPTASYDVGTRTGLYLGHTMTANPQPVLFDLTHASKENRPPAVLLCGTLGSGKTMTLMSLMHQAFMQGSLCVAVDPKGDNHIDRLPGVADHCEVIELGGDPAYRGMLDPLVIAPEAAAFDAAYSWLIGVLPHPVPSEWQSEIRQAINAVVTNNPHPTCTAVISELKASDREAATAAGRALAAYAHGGFSGLGFAAEGTQRAAGARKQVTILRIRNLPLPMAGTPRADLTEEERIGQSVIRLLAVYALYICGKKPRDQHVVVGIDESWFLLQDSAGHRMIEQLNRWGRSEFATPMLVTHLSSDAEKLDNLLGARFFLGQESEREAAAALQLLHLDPNDDFLRQRLLQARRGRGMLRDYDGRVGYIQVDVTDPAVLRALNTNPQATLEAGDPLVTA